LKKIHIKTNEMGTFVFNKEVQINECDSMIPLTRRTAGGAMSPLKEI